MDDWRKKRQTLKKYFFKPRISIERTRKSGTLHQGTVIFGLQLPDVAPMRPSPVSRQ